MRILAMVLAASIFASSVWAADPVGRYVVHGTNPGGGGEYSGTATVEKTGDTYKVVWKVGGQTYIGTGVGDHGFMAISYKSGNDTGLALYGEDGDGWKGVWTYQKGTTLGGEVWARQ